MSYKAEGYLSMMVGGELGDEVLFAGRHRFPVVNSFGYLVRIEKCSLEVLQRYPRCLRNRYALFQEDPTVTVVIRFPDDCPTEGRARPKAEEFPAHRTVS